MVEKRKKILFIVEAMGGGVFTYIVDLANELVNIYDMYIAYAVRRQTPENYRDYFDGKVKLIEVKNFGRSINPIKDLKAFFEIRKIAEQVQPDIIHLHSSKAGALGRFAFNGKTGLLFYTPHGYSFLMKNHSVLKRLIYRTVETVCGKRNCTTISCSEGEHQETLKLTKDAVYVSNGININDLHTKNMKCETISSSIQTEGIFDNVTFSTTYGLVECTANEPLNQLTVTTVSGDFHGMIPKENGFTATYHTVSGTFESEFETIQDNHMFIYGDKNGMFEFNTSSGSVTLSALPL